MKRDTGQTIVQPGETVSLKQLTGWNGLFLWARVRLVGGSPGDAVPVAFHVGRETGGGRNRAATGSLLATENSPRGEGQVLTVRDQAETMDVRARIASSSPVPVQIDWIAQEPEHAPALVASLANNFHAIGVSGSAVTPRGDAWGRTLTSAAPPQSCFRVKHGGGPPFGTQFLLQPDDVAALCALPGTDPTSQRLAGWIVVTDIWGKISVNAEFELQNLQGVANPDMLFPADANGYVDMHPNTPIFLRFDGVLGAWPKLYCDEAIFNLIFLGYILLQTPESEFA